VISRRVPMLIRPAIDDTDPIRYRRPTPDGQFSGNIIDEAMRPSVARHIHSWFTATTSPGARAVTRAVRLSQRSY
jgi:hypothetical protein